MDEERKHLEWLARHLADELEKLTHRQANPSHIQPIMVGDATRAVELSQRLADEGIKVLPIRTPTVPPGTERLRVSLSAAMSHEDIDRLLIALARCL